MGWEGIVAIIALVISLICLVWLVLMQFAGGNGDATFKLAGAGLINYPIKYFRANMEDVEIKADNIRTEDDDTEAIDDVVLVLSLVREQTEANTTAGILVTIIESLRNWDNPPASVAFLPAAVDKYVSRWGIDGISDELLQNAKQVISALSTTTQSVDSKQLTNTRHMLHNIHMSVRRR